MKAWKISGGIVLLLYVVISVFICIRKVDVSSYFVKEKLRNITLIIWGVFGLIILIGYLIWLAVLKHNK